MGTLLFYTFFHQSLLYEGYNRNIAMPQISREFTTKDESRFKILNPLSSSKCKFLYYITFLYIESFLDLRNVPSSLLWIHLLWRYFIGSGTHQLESIIEKNVIVAR